MPSIIANLLIAASVVSLTAALPSSLKTCTEYIIPVSPSSTNLIWAKPFSNNYDVVDFLTDSESRLAALNNPYKGTANVTAGYKISATFCTPNKGSVSSGNVLLLSHGLGFDSSYWNPVIQPENYSFVDYAISKGYSTFSYDRLGVGKSSSLSGYVAQASVQTAILQELATLVKSGKYTGTIGKPKKLVLLGHSFGSIISAAAITAQPDLADGLVLTGFSYNGTNGAGFLSALAPRIASTALPIKFSHLDTGYLVPVDLYSTINVFFKAPDYDPTVAKFSYDHGSPFSINEAVSGNFIDVVASKFTGAAMVIAGQYDLVFCTGLCDALITHPAQEIFSNAKAFKAVSYPGAGHGLNLASNAKGSFVEIVSFLQGSGI